MEKLNIAEILKDCPKGTKLYSTVHGYIKLIDIYRDIIRCKPDYLDVIINFNSDGRWVKNQGECILFPSKDNRDWDKFMPFNDGDIIFEGRFHSICIFKKEGSINGTVDYYCGTSFGGLHVKDEKDIDEHYGDISDYRLATEEEKERLFKAIKDNGYRWNAETKTLEKLIVPKFKVWDRIKNKASKWIYKVADIKENEYIVNLDYKPLNKNYDYHLAFCNEDDYELVPNKFDITTLKPFDKVLVRDYDLYKWRCSLYERYDNIKSAAKFLTIIGHYQQCIPFEGNEHLLGTTNDCDEYYKNW